MVWFEWMKSVERGVRLLLWMEDTSTVFCCGERGVQRPFTPCCPGQRPFPYIPTWLLRAFDGPPLPPFSSSGNPLLLQTCCLKSNHSAFFFFRHDILYINPLIFATMPVDLLHPTPEMEQRTHKLKRLVQSPNSFFMDIKCPGCFQITTVFSHAQTVVLCGNCNIMLCQPTGGKARLTEGCSYRKKVD